jgi:hypothetical protein
MALFIAYLILWFGLVYGSPSCESGNGSHCKKVSLDTRETTYQSNHLKGILENWEGHLLTNSVTVNNDSISKINTMAERIVTVFNNNAANVKLNRLTTHLDSILKPLDPIMERILIKMLSEPQIVRIIISKLKTNDPLIRSLFPDSKRRRGIILRLERQSRTVLTKRTANENHGSPSKETTPSCCECICDEKSEQCSICFSEIEADDPTLKLQCSHGSKFHDKVNLHHFL